MDSRLGTIKGFVDNFASVISDVLDTDVIITDSNMNIVGSAFKYFSLYQDIKIGSLIADVLINRHNLLIEDKSAVTSCRECEKYRVCKMKGFVGVPIHYGNQVIGVIALILPRFKVKTLFEKLDSTVSFMESMADLVAVRMMEHMEKKGLQQRIHQLEAVLDLMDDAVVYTDTYGNIEYMNTSFKREFQVNRSQAGKKIMEIYPIFQDWYKSDKDLKNVKVSIDYGSGIFYGMVKSRKIYYSGQEYGIIFCFRPYQQIHDSSVKFLEGTLVTFDWISEFVREDVIETAKELAEKDENLLITGSDNALNELIAKAVFNHSERRLEGIKVIYMQNVYRDLLDQYLMDEYGLLRSMDNGTMVIVQPEKMTRYVQDKLAELMKKEKLEVKHGFSLRINVRFIFCTTENLKELVQAGKFSEKLYLEISHHVISNPETIHNDYKAFIKFAFSGLSYYSKVWNQNREMITPGLLETLWQKYRHLSIGEIETILEKIIKEGGDDLESEGEMIHPQENYFISMKEIERRQIEALMNGDVFGKRYTKKEIGEILKISRTTLYRRMKEYGLDQKKTEN